MENPFREALLKEPKIVTVTPNDPAQSVMAEALEAYINSPANREKLIDDLGEAIRPLVEAQLWAMFNDHPPTNSVGAHEKENQLLHRPHEVLERHRC